MPKTKTKKAPTKLKVRINTNARITLSDLASQFVQAKIQLDIAKAHFDKLQEEVTNLMLAQGKQKISVEDERGRYTVSLRENKKVVDKDAVPEEFKEETVTVRVNVKRLEAENPELFEQLVRSGVIEIQKKAQPYIKFKEDNGN